MSTVVIRNEPVFEATMKAIILYDKFSLATKTKAVLERAMERADATTRWNVKPWRVNLLTLEGIGKAALNDAADAHLIVLALRQSESLPAWLPEWLEKWAGRRQVQEAALAVFDTGNGDSLSASATPELPQFAERHGLSFIFGDSGPNEDKSAVVARSAARARDGSDPDAATHQEPPVKGYDHYWDING